MSIARKLRIRLEKIEKNLGIKKVSLAIYSLME